MRKHDRSGIEYKVGDYVEHAFRTRDDGTMIPGYSGIVHEVEEGINGGILVNIEGDIRRFNCNDLNIKPTNQ